MKAFTIVITGRVLLVSNRLPVTVVEKPSLSVTPSIGGLVSGLRSLYSDASPLWIGWNGVAREHLEGKENDVEELLVQHQCRGVALSSKDIDEYYHGFSNNTLWPLFHYFPQYVQYKQSWWKAAKRVTEQFRDVVLEHYQEGDIIWIHDYHLMLLPGLLRERLPKATIGFFLHIPFPSFELFRRLPYRKEILEGLLGADLVGFHNYDYVGHFLESVRQLLGHDHTLGLLSTDKRVVKTDSFPLGIDFEDIQRQLKEDSVTAECARIKKQIGNRSLILSVDRLDYSKGVVARLLAYDCFLSHHPEFVGKVSLILVAVPSRTKVPEYASLKRELDRMVGLINGKYGSLEWTPVVYMYDSLPFEKLLGLYSAADVALVTPERDGMNLIAKEFVASRERNKGVLILSEMAGSAKDLGEALLVNPHNLQEVADALYTALTMPVQEQIAGMSVMRKRLERFTSQRWAEQFLAGLNGAKAEQASLSSLLLSPEKELQLITDFRSSQNRLVILDYDGTLVPFSKDPLLATPDAELITLLKSLRSTATVVLISGRDRNFLDEHFGKMGVALIAEHGAWTKKPDGSWECFSSRSDDWKDFVRGLLQGYCDRTPGSFIEEKHFSLAWHYREVDSGLASVRLAALKALLLALLSNFDLQLLEGNRVLEIKPSGIHKGQALEPWLSGDPEFILALGDDATDEDVFEQVPERAYTIKVRPGQSKARYRVVNYVDVLSLLHKLL